MSRFLIIPAVLLLVLFTPDLAQAQLVPMQCAGNDPSSCGSCEFVQLVNNVIQFIIVIASSIAVLVFIFAGFRMLTSGGNAEAAKKAREMITSVAVGYVIILAAFLFIDLLFGILLNDDSSALGWRSVECIYPIRPAAGDPGFFSGPRASSSSVIGSGGTCEVLSTGPCSVENLRDFFPDNPEEASRICNKESGGKPIKSGSDLCCGPGGDCDGAPSFSGGYFQVNVLSENDKIPGCSGNFFTNNGGSTIQGDCVRRNARGICTGWSCSITDQSMYNRCMDGAINPAVNFQVTDTLYSSRGWDPWRNSRNLCGI